jgi:hypothetical protein
LETEETNKSSEVETLKGGKLREKGGKLREKEGKLREKGGNFWKNWKPGNLCSIWNFTTRHKFIENVPHTNFVST